MSARIHVDDAVRILCKLAVDTSGTLNVQVTREFRNFAVYAGGENLTGYKQKHPIIGCENPWSDSFDSTLVYGPISGAMVYAGIRAHF